MTSGTQLTLLPAPRAQLQVSREQVGRLAALGATAGADVAGRQCAPGANTLTRWPSGSRPRNV